MTETATHETEAREPAAPTRIPLDEATPEQIRTFCRVVMGLPIADRENVPTMRAKLEKADYTLDFINLPQTAAPPSGHTSATEAFNTRINPKTGQKEIRILVHVQDRAGGDEPVPVNVNGSNFFIPRGEPCWVPEKFVGALADAKEKQYDEYDPARDGGRGGLGEPRYIQSYPFSFA